MSTREAVNYIDSFTEELFNELLRPGRDGAAPATLKAELKREVERAKASDLTQTVVDLFTRLLILKREQG